MEFLVTIEDKAFSLKEQTADKIKNNTASLFIKRW